MKINKIDLALQVCHLYYENKVSQVEIAERLSISRPTVSRLIQFAHDQGLVKVTIINPTDKIEVLETQLEQKFKLKKAIVVYSPTDDANNLYTKLGRATANYLDDIVKDGDKIGVSWGKTIEAVADELHETKKKNLSVVQLKGSLSFNDFNTFSNEITQKFGDAFHTQSISIPLPVIFDNAITKEIVLQDRFLKNILTQAQETNIALYTVGTTRDDALLFNLDYFSPQEIKLIQEKAVGDILSRFINQDGQVAIPEINNRTNGLEIERLKEKAYSILVAGGLRKFEAIQAALKGEYANIFVTDNQTAANLLK